MSIVDSIASSFKPGDKIDKKPQRFSKLLNSSLSLFFIAFL